MFINLRLLYHGIAGLFHLHNDLHKSFDKCLLIRPIFRYNLITRRAVAHYILYLSRIETCNTIVALTGRACHRRISRGRGVVITEMSKKSSVTGNSNSRRPYGWERDAMDERSDEEARKERTELICIAPV